MLKLNQRIYMVAWLYWDPPKYLFNVPFLERPVAWYGILFVLGFILGYFIIIPVFSRFLRQTKTFSTLDILNWPLLLQELIGAKENNNEVASQVMQMLNAYSRTNLKAITQEEATLDLTTKQQIVSCLSKLCQDWGYSREEVERAFPGAIASLRQTSCFLADRLCWFIVAGTLIGARLGLVFFYDWSYYKSQPMEIFKIWKGGLASHGGTIGIVVALYLYQRFIKKYITNLSFRSLMDCVAVPTALVACFIRIGNFINQEILGNPTDMPWGVIFGDTVSGATAIPRHPVQLYEAIAYFFIFVLLYQLWKQKGKELASGVISGLLFVLVFSSRFFLEFFKETQESILTTEYIQMGQLLSIPFIFFGLYLIWSSQINRKFTRFYQALFAK